MRKITFHEEADAEVTEATRYYETKSEGLGFSFLAELEAAIDQILAKPEAYQRVGGEVRRKRFRRFPYNLLFVIESDRIRVVAVAHEKRRPSYWRSRV